MGFCVSLGAKAEIELADELKIILNGKEEDAPVTRKAMEIMAPDQGAVVRIAHDLPMSQGFGMSAAGTFAACLALAVYLDIPDPKYAALKVTHISEVRNQTGLGDAVAQSIGGFVHRVEPGIPPHGEFERLELHVDEVVLCVLGENISTSEIISSPERRGRIRDSGHACLKDFEIDLDLASFINTSWAFARDSGLATNDMIDALKEIKDIGQGSMVMLGNSIFAFGDADALEDKLKNFGQVFRTKVCQSGATIAQL